MEKIIDALSWIDMVAATVWILLTIIMFWVLYRLYEAYGSSHKTFQLGIALLIAVWLYPLYTFLFNQLEVGFVGNILTLALTLVYRRRLTEHSKTLANWMIPQIIWLVLATFYVGCMLVLKYQLS